MIGLIRVTGRALLYLFRRAGPAAAAALGRNSRLTRPPTRAEAHEKPTAPTVVPPLEPTADLAQEDPSVKASGPQVLEIRWWRGYRQGRFYVEADRVIESRSFRARSGDVPEEDGAAVDALEALVEELVAAGWEQDGRGAHWFSTRFRPQGTTNA